MTASNDPAATATAVRTRERTPGLLLTGEHDLCPGCGEPLALRLILECLEELELQRRTIMAVGIGCYTAFTQTIDLDLVQTLHGRAPAVATGIKRMRPDSMVLTLQGDGDMVNEGLQDVLHAAARGEQITCFMLNNGVFGETGGHMTATTVLGQRTKTSLEGRDVATHGRPLQLADMLAGMDVPGYVARGAVDNPGRIHRTKTMIRRALQTQMDGAGFSLVEILTMCPTGWFVPTSEGPDYLHDTLGRVHGFGELKVPDPTGSD